MSTLKKKYNQLRKLRIRNVFFNTVCALLTLAGALWGIRFFWRYSNYEITNDAFIDQYIVPVNIRISGYIKKIYFTEHQYVHCGDTLLVLEDDEYKIRLQESRAALLDAKGAKEVLNSGIETSIANIAIQEANIQEAKAQLWQYEQDFYRYKRLLADESVPQQQFEQIKARYESAKARLQSLEQHKQAVSFQCEETHKRTISADAAILHKQAELDMAKLNLSYTVVTAPYDGYMGRRSLEVGQYIQAGQSISYLTRDDKKWITANYKETQIANIHIGQKVEIKVDAYKQLGLIGTVTAISDATGAKYALVPTDNSAGNFVKVQQRIPVRIDLDDVSPEYMRLLRAGMMVETAAIKE